MYCLSERDPKESAGSVSVLRGPAPLSCLQEMCRKQEEAAAEIR